MNKLFNRILVPVNFSRNTVMVVEKAIAVANEFKCDVYLLHTHSSRIRVPVHFAGNDTGTTPGHGTSEENHLKELLKKYGHTLGDGLSIDGEIASGNWFDTMKQFIIARHIDLVIIPRNAKEFWNALFHRVNINRLARQTNCPILVVTPHFDINHLKNIVVPVHDFLPIRKLTAATYIARRFNSIIHLMGFKKSFHARDPGDTKCLTKAYQLLRDHTQLRIYRSSSYGDSVASKTLSYAKLVEADLIVINSGNESVLGGWLSRLSGENLYRKSDIAVLTIAPQQ